MSHGREEVSAEQVAQYLQEHKEFFIAHSELLADLSLPHESGGAVSLLERQVKILRDRSIESRHTLNSLLENARYNDQLFSVTRNLILTLMEEHEVSQIASVTQANLCTQPGIDACSLILLADPRKTDSRETGSTRSALTQPASNKTVPSSPPKSANPEIGREILQRFPSLFRSPAHVVSQTINREAAQLLFPQVGITVRSAALCPIAHQGSILAVLAIGNQAQDYFNEELDTLFLDFIGEFLGSLLHRCSWSR